MPIEMFLSISHSVCVYIYVCAYLRACVRVRMLNI